MKWDMTQGNPIKVIWNFSVSILIGNIFQQLYNMVDSIIVGKILGVKALAAVGSTGSINFLVLGFVIGICTGFGIPIAQFVGAKDERNVKKCIINAGYLAVIISVILTIATVLATGWMLRVMRTPADIYQDAYDYIVIIFAGLGAAMFYNLLTSISRGMGDVRTPLIFLIVASVLNVILDYILIKFTPLGTAGAAYATVAAQLIAGILCMIYMYRKYPILHVDKEDRAMDPAIMKRLLLVGIPMALQYSITAIGTIIVQVAVNTLGSLIVASVTAAIRIQSVITQPFDAMGLTLTTFCGQNYGAGKIERIQKGIRQTIILAFGISAVLLGIVYFLGEPLTGLFVKGENLELVRYTRKFMNINGIFFWSLGLLIVLRNAIQGLGYAGAAMFAGVFETIGRIIVAFGLAATLGYTAICFANPTAWIMADILLVGAYIWVMKRIKTRYGMA